MSDKMDRQGVRTPADIERKYNLGQITSAQGSSAKVGTLVQQLQQNMNTRFDELSALVIREEQEKTIDITENGTTEVLPDENKVLSKVTINSNVPDTSGIIEDIIDNSGVLDSTEGTATEKVEQLIDKAEIYNNASGISFTDTNFESITLDCEGFTSLYGAFNQCVKLKEVHLSNTQNISNWNSAFYTVPFLHTVETINFSSLTRNPAWSVLPELKTFKVVPNTIKVSITLNARSLTNGSGGTFDSIQSIIDGLATVTTAQTLTLNSAITLTDEQKATINAKGWTLAQ